MKQIPIQHTLWSPPVRTMQRSPFRRPLELHLGTRPVGYCVGGVLTVFGLGQYQIS